MSRERIYASYRVEVENLDGSKQEFTFDSIDTSYKDMLDRYREIKDKFSDDKNVYCITFIGVKKDGSMKAVYPPKIVNSKENKVNKTPFDEIKDILDNIKRYGDLYGNYEQWYYKKLDELLHDVESAKFVNEENLNDYKIKVFDSLFNLRDERRDFKNRSIASKSMLTHGNLKVNYLSDLSKIWNKSNTFKEEDINSNVKCYRISYVDEEEKNYIIKDLKDKGYSHILELPDNSIGYYQKIYDRKIKEEQKNDINDDVGYGIESFNSNELDLLYGTIRTITYGQKVPKQNKKSGTDLQIRCHTEGQIKDVIKNNKDIYNKIMYIKDKKTVRLLERKVSA